MKLKYYPVTGVCQRFSVSAPAARPQRVLHFQIIAPTFSNPHANAVLVPVPFTHNLLSVSVKITKKSDRLVSLQPFTDTLERTWQQSGFLKRRTVPLEIYPIQISGVPNQQARIYNMFKVKNFLIPQAGWSQR